MSDALWIGLVALALGALVGAALVTLRRTPLGAAAEPPSPTAALEARLELQAAEMRRLADAAATRDLTAEQLREGLDGARRALDELRVREQERRAYDDEHRQVVRRLATVLAGGASTGRAGEHVLREHLSGLPPTMLVHDFRVGGKVVEFGLLLPDGRRLPIDSKWTAVAELEALDRAAEPTERDAYAKGVVIVPYASALPIVLFLYSLVQRYGDAADVQASLAEVAGVLDSMEAVVENRFAKAATMLTNGTDEFRSQLGKARGSIARARAGVDDVDADPSPDDDGLLSIVR
jgi:hypothetical protein